MSHSFIFNELIPFDERAGRVFRFQYEKNAVYREFCNTLESKYESFTGKSVYPLLPVRAFKEADVISFSKNEAELVFKSSGTGEMQRSRHYLKSPELYRQSVVQGFSCFYDPSDFTILCYTPGYDENPDSSLVYMLNLLCKLDKAGQSRFLPLEQPLVKSEIGKIKKSGKRVMLFGAAFGLMDLAGVSGLRLPAESVVIETGGMKTYRREMTKDELHGRLSQGFGISRDQVHSEYGMCELLSQAYATDDGWFETPHWLQARVYDPGNPMRTCKPGEEGKIGIVDLANYESCSFILTDDKGVIDERGRFRVLGRWNPSDLRGCNFLIDRDL